MQAANVWNWPEDDVQVRGGEGAKGQLSLRLVGWLFSETWWWWWWWWWCSAAAIEADVVVVDDDDDDDDEPEDHICAGDEEGPVGS